jgi:hypothetical protein
LGGDDQKRSKINAGIWLRRMDGGKPQDRIVFRVFIGCRRTQAYVR